jgi:hypothetical protein
MAFSSTRRRQRGAQRSSRFGDDTQFLRPTPTAKDAAQREPEHHNLQHHREDDKQRPVVQWSTALSDVALALSGVLLCVEVTRRRAQTLSYVRIYGLPSHHPTLHSNPPHHHPTTPPLTHFTATRLLPVGLYSLSSALFDRHCLRAAPPHAHASLLFHRLDWRRGGRRQRSTVLSRQRNTHSTPLGDTAGGTLAPADRSAVDCIRRVSGRFAFHWHTHRSSCA